jgi:transcriptional regulator with XRE-family HTH domain
MFTKEIFATRLSALRKCKGINQSQLAESAGVTFHQVSKMEKAQRAASIEVLCALADYFDVSLDYLTGRSDDPARR